MNFLLLTFLFQSIALATGDIVSKNTNADSDWANPVTILAATVSIVTIIGFIGSAGKKLLAAAALETKVTQLVADVREIKDDRNKHAKILDELFYNIKEDIKAKASVDIYEDLGELQATIDAELDKLKHTVTELSQVEHKLNELKAHFDDCNLDRRNEIKELTETVKGLRDNMRDDVNDVKSIIMKLMMNLKIND